MKKTSKTIYLLFLLALLITAAPASAGDWSVISSGVLNFRPTTSSYAYSNNFNCVYAAQFSNGTVLKPGQTFSFNKIVGARTAERGFAVGVNSAGTPDVGGGVCREATVLFQTARSAGMKIIERWDHTPPVGYAASGNDAAVQYGLYDMRFSNNYHVPVMIQTRGDQDKNGLHLWAVFLKEENLTPVKVSLADNVYMDGKLFNGKTFVPANILAGIYGKEISQTEKLGFYDLNIGGFVFSEANGDILRSTNGFYVPLRKWTGYFGGSVQWLAGKSPGVALTFPSIIASNTNNGS